MIEKMSHMLPFVALVSGNAPQNRPMLTRLTEQVIVGVAAAFVAIYVSDIRQTEQISMIKETLVRIEKAVEKMQRDFYIPRHEANK